MCPALFQKFLFLKKKKSGLTIFPHLDNPPLNINIIKKRYIKRNLFVLDVECIKFDYFSPYNNGKRKYFKQLPPQVTNT